MSLYDYAAATETDGRTDRQTDRRAACVDDSST